jgi:hypothetical protein
MVAMKGRCIQPPVERKCCPGLCEVDDEVNHGRSRRLVRPQ